MKTYILQIEVSSTQDIPLRKLLEAVNSKEITDWLMDNATILRKIKNEDCA